MNLKLFLLTACLYLLSAYLIFFFNSNSKNLSVTAKITPQTVYINQAITFHDSTLNASSVLWEFGNGDETINRSGTYKYMKEGRYLIRLTINKNMQDTFSVHVFKPIVARKPMEKLSVYANSVGIKGQEIHFKIIGPKVEWCEWYFGKSGKVESRDQDAFYSFSEAGEYQVRVLTNLNPKIALLHKIKITTQYKTTDVVPLTKTKDKEGSSPDKLLMAIQSIANGGNLSHLYNQIVKDYLCSNFHVKVSVNGKSAIDFYSYCQSLQLGSDVNIDLVTPETDNKTGCVGKIIILQH